MIEDKVITLRDLAREIDKIKKQLYILTETQSSNDNFSDIEEEECEQSENIDIEHYNYLKDAVNFLEKSLTQSREENRLLKKEIADLKYDISVEKEIQKAKILKITSLINVIKNESYRVGILMFQYGHKYNMTREERNKKLSIIDYCQKEINNSIIKIKQLLE